MTAATDRNKTTAALYVIRIHTCTAGMVFCYGTFGLWFHSISPFTFSTAKNNILVPCATDLYLQDKKQLVPSHLTHKLHFVLSILRPPLVSILHSLT